jgi:hypothetical protein
MNRGARVTTHDQREGDARRRGREVAYGSGSIEKLTADVRRGERTYTTKHGAIAQMNATAIGNR